MEPAAQRILQQVQRGMEGLVKIRESGQENRPKREAAQKAMDALKKGADATRGRGRRKGRMYQRAGVHN